MNEVKKQMMYSVLRHVLTILGTLLAGYGITIDPASMEGILQMVVGLVFTSGSVIAGSLQKAKPVAVPIDTVHNPFKGWFLSDRSKKNMKGINSQLVELIEAAIIESPYDFVVIEGLRTRSRQVELVKAKASKTMNSKHLTGDAFDIMVLDENGKGTWNVEKYYVPVIACMKAIAHREGLDITFGIDWEDFLDAGHVQVGG